MAKCKNCRSCLGLVDTGEAVYRYCSLCGKYYELRSGKEIDFMSSVFLVGLEGENLIISGALFKDEEDVRNYIRSEVGLADEELIYIQRLKVGISKTEFYNKLLKYRMLPSFD